MSETITVVDRSRVREGSLSELDSAAKELAGFVAENEPRPIAFNLYLDEDGTHMTVVQIQPDTASMEEHMCVASEVFRRFADLLNDLLGTATLRVHHHGFVRA